MSIFNLEKTSSLISNSHNILIVSHYDPDGDALGSSIGLYEALIKIKKIVMYITGIKFRIIYLLLNVGL